MTWNVLFAAARSPLGPWSARGPVVRDTVVAAAPDVLCLQEIDPDQVEFAHAGIPGFSALLGETNGLSPYPRRIVVAAPIALALWAWLFWRFGPPPFGAWWLWLTHAALLAVGVLAPLALAGIIRYRGPYRPPGSLNPILYRPERVRPLTDGCVWLSHRPLRPGTAFPLLIEPRVLHWARFALRDGGPEFLIVNVHLGHAPWHYAGSARLVLETIARERPSPDAPVFLLGDFNAVPGSGVVRRLLGSLKLAWDAAETREGPETTFQWNLVPGPAPLRLDHVLFAGPVRAVAARVLTPRVGGKPPSDHDPLIVDLEVTG
jgi:endonuclease/exonuclease/phosphatase family metal-dependent hydrolase